jgi:amidohydrolase
MTDDTLLADDLVAWRHDFHAHPEFGFEERRTAALVAERLRAFGLDEVVEGIGGTGVVGTLRRGRGNRAVALRADMDALRIAEAGERPYRSTVAGTMHACGHDGHTTMLLGAAALLARDGGFDGVVRFVFQPAEEWGRGAQAMLDDGLAARFPYDEVFGLHTMPGLPAGRVETRGGALLAAEDIFEIALTGVGGHAARPHAGNEAMVAGAALVTALQTIVSRRLDPGIAAVVSVTEFLTDGTRNVLPGHVRLRGDARSFDASVSAQIECAIADTARGVAAAFGLACEVAYAREFVPLVNDGALAAAVLAAAAGVVGPDAVGEAAAPITASEDFARLTTVAPGCFAFIGNGEDSPPLHNPAFDFNDAILLTGSRLFAAIARARLPA